MNKNLFNKKGVSLIEVLVVTSVFSIVFLGFNSMVMQLVYQQERLNAKQELFSIIMDMQTRLSSPITCRSLIGEEGFGSGRLDRARQTLQTNPKEFFKNAPGAFASIKVNGGHIFTRKGPSKF